MLKILLLLLVVASWVYWLIACSWVRAHFRTWTASDTHFTPPVSILKPVKGLDAGAYENFASFCQQDYPDYELIFGVADAADPVIPIVQQLQRDFPATNIRLMVIPTPMVNPKAGLLHAMTAAAGHPVLVVSDSDVRVTRDYVRRVVAPLADCQVGLVTCLYRGEEARTLTARLEALYMGATFLPSVLVARRFLDMRFALGATLALRRDDLERLGGFAAVGDYLADDYQLGWRIRELGLRVHLSDYLVAVVLGATTFREQWDREVRWMHCTRVSRPLEYPGLILTFTTPLAVSLALASGFDPLSCWTLAVSLLLRWLVAWLVSGYSGDRALRRWLFWLPVRDMLSGVIWCAGLAGRRVVWRGESFVLRPGGRLAQAPPALKPAGLARILRPAARTLDAWLRRCLGIYEFCSDAECVLRLAVRRSQDDLTLSDGTRIERGTPIGELHLWNEHIPAIPPEGPDLAWALAFRRRLAHSLAQLAAHVETHPDTQDLRAFRAELYFGSRYALEQWRDMLRRWGFELVDKGGRDGRWGRLANWVHALYAWVLIWAFNPASLQGARPGELRLDRLWMARGVLRKRYSNLVRLNKSPANRQGSCLKKT